MYIIKLAVGYVIFVVVVAFEHFCSQFPNFVFVIVNIFLHFDFHPLICDIYAGFLSIWSCRTGSVTC